MASSFNVRDAGAYEQLMGRWSKALAPQLIDFAGIAREQKILDVGCGTGSLTFALAGSPSIREIVAIDFSPLFVSAAAERNGDPRITFRQADACALPFEDGGFDAALALLVLHFVPEAHKAIAEMRRVVRAGGAIAAAVWDHLGGLPSMRITVDTVAALSEGGRALRKRYASQPMMQPGEMKQAFEKEGLREVVET
jgi:ubiquinone/menaquinone biosynthesis C-methylase UbiE